jgi:tetratricopeptide (TPR) repeat protein
MFEGAVDPLLSSEELHLSGLKALEANDPASALALFEKALALDPKKGAYWNNQGNAYTALGNHKSAVENYLAAIALEKSPPYLLYFNLASAYYNLGHWSLAMAQFELAVQCEPERYEAYFGRGLVWDEMSEPSLAIQSYADALERNPTFAQAYNNMGIAFQNLGVESAALECFDSALALEPESGDFQINKGLLCLQYGHWEEGWQYFESRWKTKALNKVARHFDFPLWLGKESLNGKTLLVHCEQGMGDTIQFCRFIPMLLALGAKLTLAVQAPLHTLLEANFPTARVLPGIPTQETFDFHCPIMSLGLALTADFSNIPNSVGYLTLPSPAEAKWAAFSGEVERPCIGLVWSGSATHTNDANRSVALTELLKVLPAGPRYLSLQKEYRDGDLEQALAAGLEDVSAQLLDFSDTAALCQQCDLIVSVDTSVAHLAGALGVPTLLLLPFNADWRWLTGRKDSPWYRSFQLLRQTNRTDWAKALAQLAYLIDNCNLHA